MDLTGETCFSDQSFERGVADGAGAVRAEQFQSAGLVKKLVVDEVNFAHAACSDAALDDVVAQHIVGGQVGIGVLIPRVFRTGKQDILTAVGAFAPVAQHPEFTFHLFVTFGADDQHPAVAAAAGHAAVGTFHILSHQSFIDRKFFLTIFASHNFSESLFDNCSNISISRKNKKIYIFLICTCFRKKSSAYGYNFYNYGTSFEKTPFFIPKFTFRGPWKLVKSALDGYIIRKDINFLQKQGRENKQGERHL